MDVGTIVYFTPFYYKDNSTPEPKFFIVLHLSEDKKAILATLPTSQTHVPDFLDKKHGCMNYPEGGVNCYHFEANVPITDNGWSFSKPTYIHALWLDVYDLTILETKYAIENVDYQIKGKLKKEEYNAIIACFLLAGTVKRRVRNILTTIAI